MTAYTAILRRLDNLLRRNTDGVVSIEIAVIMPMFLLLTFGAFELASYQILQGEVHHSVRDVGRSLSVGHMQAADAGTAVTADLVSWGANPVTTVTETTDDITLRVTVPLSEISTFNFLDTLLSMSAEASLTFRKE